MGSPQINLMNIMLKKRKQVIEKYIPYNSRRKTKHYISQGDAIIDDDIIEKSIVMFKSKGRILGIYEKKGDTCTCNQKRTHRGQLVLALSVLLFNLGGNYKVLLCYYYLKSKCFIHSYESISHNKKIVREYSFIPIHL